MKTVANERRPSAKTRCWKGKFGLSGGAVLRKTVFSGFTLAITFLSRAHAEIPWCFQEALQAVDTLSDLEGLELSGSFRVRYEGFDGPIQTTGSASDQILAIRTLLKADYSSEGWGLVGEFQDSRQELADEGSLITTASVNTAELLQGYLKLNGDDLIPAGSRMELRLGRQTIDAGSRRLVARNRFRNTSNTFDGGCLYWDNLSGFAVQTFYVLPVVRRPSDAEALLNNESRLDRSFSNYQFWGIHGTWKDVLGTASGELYLYRLEEADSKDLPTENRHLYTPGARLYRKPAKSNWDCDLEMAVQFGEQQNSNPTNDFTDLDHWAQFVHLEVGWSVDMAGSPRVALLFDYASGDLDPDDNQSNRFDPLFGARRFDYGPTGIYGSVARTNIVSPGVSLNLKPTNRVQAQLAYRPLWLASDTDAWSISGLRDPSGMTSPFVGQQIETSLQWELVPGRLSLEVGAAYLFAGSFIQEVPNSTGQGDSMYVYSSVSFTF